MLSLRSFALLLSLTLPCQAALADSHTVDPSRVLSVVSADWNKDGSFDRALLIDNDNEDGADLYVYLDVDSEDKTTIIKGGFAWRGSMWGQQATISLNKQQSLVVHTQNTGIGRNAWEQTIIIAWRDEQFVVAGYTFNSYDRLDPNNVVECDLNLLTGKGTRNDKVVKLRKKKPSLLLWNQEEAQGLCNG